jgi:1-deoxy-D-xylulose-5-phosphate synthase
MLESIKGPHDLKRIPSEQLGSLAEEIRQFLITKVSKTGGHLGPNLGVVELTMAIHRTFDSPKDVILFDTGHQSYVHKILTGRADQFDALRQRVESLDIPIAVRASMMSLKIRMPQPRFHGAMESLAASL